MKILSFISFLLMPVAALAAGPLALKTHDFQELKVRGPLNVEYVSSADSAGMILISGIAEEQLSWVEASGSGRKLTLHLRVPDEQVSVPRELPSVRVYSSYLTKVENEGDSTLIVNAPEAGARFSALVIGNGRVSVRDIKAGEVEGSILSGHGVVALSGDCNKASLKLTGTGVIQADALRATDGYVWCTGTGTVGVWAVKTLKIKGAGSGTVYIKGTPEISQKTVGVKIQMIE
ncbi:MAG: DUF2807 domain-containing protein [Muribaculaceae bacterium]|nr:DUF2807 domain-containing protein [Muribaculaceae bacterium]MDE7110585.1 DUF2807 domain-containing protein [Muribaculaceae bacterium]